MKEVQYALGLLYTPSAMGGLYDQINDRLFLPD